MLALRSQRRSATSGFSLIEIMGVILVIGLLAGLVSVNYTALIPRAKLNASVHELASTIHGTRSDAISRNAVFLLVYDLDANRYHVRTPFATGGGWAKREEEKLIVRDVVLPGEIDMTQVMLEGEQYTDGMVVARFDPRGNVSDHSVVLTQGGIDAVFTIEVLPLTGLVRFHEGLFEREEVDDGDFD